MIGKCPSCQKPITYLKGCGAQVEFVGEVTQRAWTYTCPDCDSILGCQMEPPQTQKPPKQS